MQKDKTKILFLYAEVMSYNVALFKEYVKHHNAEVYVVHWDKQKKTPYVAPDIEGVTYFGKSTFDSRSLLNFALQLQPSFVITSGWMDKLYITVCKQLRKNKISVIAASDTQYYNNLRQNIGKYYFKLFYKSAFSHIWVAGAYQYEYAKRLGFKNNQILFNFLSADLDIFNAIYFNTMKQKQNFYPHKFLFAGRFAQEKGLDLLIEAWNTIDDKKDWKLCLVGNGPLKEKLYEQSDIEIHDFVQPEQFESIVQQSGCFILPSKMEPWALVLHEFSAAGLPIICSNACGAAPTFVIHKYNGFVFESNNVLSLIKSIEKIIAMTDEQLVQFSFTAHQIGQRITPSIVASTSMSILD
jgi:glycosyltransferase involved in cell wall biosynthesis